MTFGYTGMNPFMNTVGMDMMMNAPILGPGCGMGYGMGVGMMNPQTMMTNIQQWDDFGMNRQVSTYKNQNNARFQMQAQNGSIERQVRILAQEIRANNQDNVKAEYNKLLQAVRSAYGSQVQGGSDKDYELSIKQYADQIYAQYMGTYMTDDIKAHSTSSFVTGLKQMFSFGLSNKTTADENIATITGAKQTDGSKAGKTAGNIVGGLLGGLVAVGGFFLGKSLLHK